MLLFFWPICRSKCNWDLEVFECKYWNNWFTRHCMYFQAIQRWHSCGCVFISKGREQLTKFSIKSLLSIKVIWIWILIFFLTRFAWTQKQSRGINSFILNTCYETLFTMFFFGSPFPCSFFKCALIRILFPLEASTFSKHFQKVKGQQQQRRAAKKKFTQNGTNCWNFIYPFGQKVMLSISHLWVCFHFLARTQFFTFSTSVVQSDAMFRRFIFFLSSSLLLLLLVLFLVLCHILSSSISHIYSRSVHSDEQHFYSNSFVQLDILTVLNEQELFVIHQRNQRTCKYLA